MKNIPTKHLPKFLYLQNKVPQVQEIEKKFKFFSTKNSVGQLSHSVNSISEKEAIDEARIRVSMKWEDLPSNKRYINQQLFNEAIKIPLVRYMLTNKGLNGYWTDYVLNHGKTSHLIMSNLEKKILEEFPLVKATQERDQIFSVINQKAVKNDACLAIIPCGLSRDIMNTLKSISQTLVKRKSLCVNLSHLNGILIMLLMI